MKRGLAGGEGEKLPSVVGGGTGQWTKIVAL